MMTSVQRLLAASVVLFMAGCAMMPAPGIKNVSVSSIYYEPPNLAWWPVAHAERYQLQVAADPDFNRLVIDELPIRATSYQLPSKFEDEKRYWWRVRVAGGALTSADWSAIHSFSFGVKTPAPLAARHPSDFRVAWEPVEGVTIYQLVVATPGRLDSPVLDRQVSDPPVIIEEGLARGVDYLWRVRALRGRLVSDWSEPQPLRVEPEGIEIIAPPRAEVRTLRPRLAWKPTPGAINVQVKLFESADGITKGREIISDVADASRGYYRPDFNLDAGGKYFYRVRLIFAGGPGPWSRDIPLAVAEAAADGAVTVADSAGRHETEPAISPDGTRLAAVVCRKSSKELQLDRAKEEASAYSAIVVYGSKEKGQKIAEALKLVASARYGGAARYRNPRFAPGGEALYADKIVDGAVATVIFSEPDGRETAVVRPPSPQVDKSTVAGKLPDRQPSVSPDGAIRVWAAEDNGNWDIFMEDLKTHRVEAVTSSLADDTNPIITTHPDGYAIIFQSNRGPGGWGIYKVVIKAQRQPEATK